MVKNSNTWVSESNDSAYFFIGSYTNNSRSGKFLTNSKAGSSYSQNLVDKWKAKKIMSDVIIGHFEWCQCRDWLAQRARGWLCIFSMIFFFRDEKLKQVCPSLFVRLSVSSYVCYCFCLSVCYYFCLSAYFIVPSLSVCLYLHFSTYLFG